MTNEELLQGIATRIAFLVCDNDDPAPYRELNSFYKAKVDKAAQAILDHLTPMIREVVGALVPLANIAEIVPNKNDLGLWSQHCNFKKPARLLASDAHKARLVLASLPQCWRGKEGE